MEIALNTLLGANIPHARYVSRLLARFFHLLPPHMPRVGHNVQLWTEARKSKNHLARIQPEIVDFEKKMECRVSKSSINTDTTAFEKAPLSIKLDSSNAKQKNL